ncbi:extracellular solute-binding protein [Actinomycetes bacterium KLBMP 9759]
MRGHRLLQAATAACVAMVAFAACAPGPTVDEPAASGPKTIDMSSFRGQQLDYVYFTDGPDEAATRDLIGKFEAETGAKVNLQIVPYADLEKTLQARINSGTPPHVARVQAWAPYQDALVDMKTYFGAQFPDQFVAGPATAAQAADGRMLGVPSDLTMNGPLVNVDAFNKAGVPLPTTAKPWTWDEMVAAATAVQKANGMESAIAIDKSGHRLSTVLSEFGTAMIGPDGKEGLDPVKAQAALGTLNDLVRSGAMLKDFWLESGTRYKGANEQFLAQQVAVYISGNWQVAQFAKNATFTWAAAPNPCAERCGGFPGGKYMVAFSGSANPDLGAAFAEWMNRADAQKTFAQVAYWMPTRKELVDGGVTYPSRQEDMATFLADVAATPEGTYAANGSPAFTPAATLLVKEVSAMFAGQKDPAATAQAVKAGVAELVAKGS